MADLLFDADQVDADLIVTCRLSEGPRRDDPTFQPRPGDALCVDDGAGSPLPAVVLRCSADDVVIRLLQPDPVLVQVLRELIAGPPAGPRRTS